MPAILLFRGNFATETPCLMLKNDILCDRYKKPTERIPVFLLQTTKAWSFFDPENHRHLNNPDNNN